MRENLVPKIVTAALLGSLFGWYIHHDEVRWGLLGREAFIASQMHRFDVNMVSPRPLAVTVVVMALLALGVCVVYESVVSGLSAIMKGMQSDKAH